MRIWLGVMAVAGCAGSPSNPSGPDASSGIDAMVIDAPPSCATSVPFAADEVFGLAVNGTELLVSLRSSGFALHAVSTTGSAPIATSSEAIRVATRSGVAFYALKLMAGYEVHQRAGADDTVLGVVSTAGPIELAASAADVYALGPKGARTVLWRISRSGGAAIEVTSVTAAAAVLRVGNTIAAFYSYDAGGMQVVTLPGPAQPTVFMPPGGGPMLAGDAGFTYSAGMLTQNTKWWAVNQFYPVTKTVVTATVYQANLPGAFTDDRYLYTTDGKQYRVINGQTSSAEVSRYCPVGPLYAYDDDRHYGITLSGTGMFSVNSALRPL